MALSSAELYSLILSALTYLQDDGGQFERGVERAGLDRDEFWLLNRFRYFPGSVAPSDFLTFGPYTSSSSNERALDSLVEKSYAEQVNEGRYRLTETGRKLVETLYRDYFNAISKHTALPDDDVQRLGTLAGQAVASVVRQPEVPAPITNAARSTFPENDHGWVYAERRVVAMALFREDAYIAAWREEGWSGPQVAVSSALFKAPDYRLSASQLREAVVHLTDKDFNSALAALHSGGEVAHTSTDYFRLTVAGRKARQFVEDLADRNYAVMFKVLEPSELNELTGLLGKIQGSQAR